MLKIICIGAGKLAHHLMPALEKSGCTVIQIYNRSLPGAQSLASRLRASEVIHQIGKIRGDADIYFFAIKDDASAQVARQLSFLENNQSIFVHTSGILGLSILPFKRKGIFYPLQTFSLQHDVDWKNTPLLITSDAEEVHDTLCQLATRISNLVYSVKDEDRAILHLGAVFANNFTNHMLTLAEDLCNTHNVNFDILKPIIRETIEKALDVGPVNSQTGPAIRGDRQTIEKHLMLLQGNTQLQELYLKITESIINRSQDKNLR